MKHKKSNYSGLISYINENLKIAKVRIGLMKEYERGAFYSIPEGIFDKTNETYKDYIYRLKRLFEQCEEPCQTVPRGLYNLSNPEDNDRFFEVLKRKIEKGIYLDFYPVIVNHEFSDEDLEKFLAIRELNTKNEIETSVRYIQEKNVFNALGNPALEFSQIAKAKSYSLKEETKEKVPEGYEPIPYVNIAYRKGEKEPQTVKEIRKAIDLYARSSQIILCRRIKFTDKSI